MNQHLDHTIQVVAVKSAPPVAITALSIWGVPLQDWVYIVTIVYVVMQAALLVYNFGVKKHWWKF
jgi:hypothetical protein